jgi:hypothetical protein
MVDLAKTEWKNGGTNMSPLKRIDAEIIPLAKYSITKRTMEG